MNSTISSLLATTTSKSNFNLPLPSLNYWFSTPDQASFGQQTFWEILSTLILILALLLLAFKLLRKGLTPPEKKFLDRTMLTLVWFGPIGWFLILSRYLGIVFFSARFLWVLWSGAFALVVAYLARFYLRTVPQKNAQYQSYLLKKQYLPKRKKR